MVDWKKVLGTSVLSAGLVFSSFSLASAKTPADPAQNVKASVSVHNEDGTIPFLTKDLGSPFDAGLVNPDKVRSLLINQGFVDKKASVEQQNKQITNYLAKRAEAANNEVAEQKSIKQVRSDLQKKAGLKQKPAKPVKVKSNNNINGVDSNGKDPKVKSIKKEKWDGPVRTDKVLVLLIQYPDDPHNTIDPNKDDPVLYYPDFTQEHYQNMIFGKNGYEGPSGQKLISVKQFYDQQSGGSYTVDGQVSKWYTAKHPAAYYGENDPETGSDGKPRELINEALADAAADPDIDLSQYDLEDEFDFDGDGNYREPDGIIDHLMVVHSGVGEEAGGGSLGPDAIWSHSWNTGFSIIPGTSGQSQTDFDLTGNNSLMGYRYTVEPEDGAAGVFAHEYGHNLGLPDDYDTHYTADSVGAPTGYWTIMSSGSWSGTIPGTEPTGFTAKDKEYLQSTMPDSNWFHDTVYNLDDLKNGTDVLVDEASVKGRNTDGVRINLPDKKTVANTPASGDYEFFSGSANDIDNVMTTTNTIDLSTAKSAELTFKTWYSIEQGFDYAYVNVLDEQGKLIGTVAGNITTNEDPNGIDDDDEPINKGNGITGESDGWKDASFDLSAYAGQKVKLQFEYVGDAAVAQAGFYADDVQVTVDGQAVLDDNADSAQTAFTFDGFSKSNGTTYTEQYYLAEWRNYADADTSLLHLNFGGKIMNYEPGLVVWYVDNKYDDNWVGDHPGDGFLGVVDAHQAPANWVTPDGDLLAVASTQYQIADAAFSLNPTDKTFLNLTPLANQILKLDAQPAVPTFDDSNDYTEPAQIYAGRNIPTFGLKISVVGQAKDMSVGRIALHVTK